VNKPQRLNIREKLGVSCTAGKAYAQQAAYDVTTMFQVVLDVFNRVTGALKTRIHCTVDWN
jgi:hypothetical protein